MKLKTTPALLYLSFLAPLAGLHAQTTGQPQTSTYSYTGAPISIPGKDTGISAVAEIYVPDNRTISTVTAQVQLNSPSVGDLKVYLFSARNTRTILLSNDCTKLAAVNTTFDDSAPTKYSDFCPVEPGRGPFRGDEPLSNSKGEDAAGYWDLVVTNTNSNTTSGVIQAFSLTISGSPVTTPTFNATSVVNSASGAGGVIAPGELVSIFGLALGPQSGVQSTGSTAVTNLGGTSVTVNGNQVPILFSSYNQVNFQVPYSLSSRTAQIQVQGPSGSSSSVTVDVLSSAAGLFTSQTNGRGPVLALNQNGSVNSISNPAAAGSYISLYATGLGAVTPAVMEGTIASSQTLSNVSSPPSVIIGGLTAPVYFAGLAPGYSGLYQLNVQIPPTTPSGPARVFVVMPNGYSSQSGVYLYVQ